MDTSGRTGMVLEIQRMSTEDGPGLRTTLFLKGCPLHCPWCHNPESISPNPQIQWFSRNCIGCGSCIKVCSQNALKQDASGSIQIEQDSCTGCGDCVNTCPTTAVKLFGELWTVDETVEELLKDLAYFKSEEDGGITISGGEAVMQAEFVHEVFTKLKQSGISTAIDTCGVCSREDLTTASEQADIILYDIKYCNPETHRSVVGGDLNVIIENLDYLASTGKRIWIRTPIIPGYTDSLDNISGIASILKRILEEYGRTSIELWELCAFNDLCADKYARMGMNWPFTGTALMSNADMDALVSKAVSIGFPAEKIRWTGMTRLEDE